MRLKRSFFNRPTLLVARELLGKYLVRRIGRKTITGMITETEAYCGPKDRASHASKGLTERTKIMFGPPGFVYVYMIYGMYHCLNIVTGKKGYPAAALIRGIEVSSIKYKKYGKMKNQNQPPIHNTNPLILLNGPGKVCREFKIDRKLNSVDVCRSKEIWIENRREKIKPSQIKKAKRFGVDYAMGWKDKLWRFYIKAED